ncbi:MAG: hypothetical protein IPH35_19180 [Rhodoferax sp.]|nr:hypothetical protein [Rhodoferax sp.]
MQRLLALNPGRSVALEQGDDHPHGNYQKAPSLMVAAAPAPAFPGAQCGNVRFQFGLDHHQLILYSKHIAPVATVASNAWASDSLWAVAIAFSLLVRHTGIFQRVGELHHPAP